MFIDKLWSWFDRSTHAGPQYSPIWMGAWRSGLLPKPHCCFEPPEGLERDLGAQLIIWLLVSHQWPHFALWCCLQRLGAAGWWSRFGSTQLFVVWQVAKKQGMSPVCIYAPHKAYLLSRKGNNGHFRQNNFSHLRLGACGVSNVDLKFIKVIKVKEQAFL